MPMPDHEHEHDGHADPGCQREAQEGPRRGDERDAAQRRETGEVAVHQRLGGVLRPDLQADEGADRVEHRDGATGRDALDAVDLLEEEVQEDGDRHDAGADEQTRPPRALEAGDALEPSPGLGEGDLVGGLVRPERERLVDGRTPHRLIEAGQERPRDEGRDGQQHEPEPPADDVSQEGAEQHEAATDGVGGPVDAVDPAVLHRRVVVGQQADVNGLVHHPADAGTEAGQDEQSEGSDEAGEPGEQRHRTPREGRQRHHVDPVAAVGVEAHWHHQHDHERRREGADADDRRLGDVERVADVRREHAVGHLVELVDHVQQEQHEQGQVGRVPGGLLQQAARTLHRSAPLATASRVLEFGQAPTRAPPTLARVERLASPSSGSRCVVRRSAASVSAPPSSRHEAVGHEARHVDARCAPPPSAGTRRGLGT